MGLANVVHFSTAISNVFNRKVLSKEALSLRRTIADKVKNSSINPKFVTDIKVSPNYWHPDTLYINVTGKDGVVSEGLMNKHTLNVAW